MNALERPASHDLVLPVTGELVTGVRALASTAYHADDIDPDRPSLSASIAHILVTQSPKHAWTAHPRLNPEYERRDDAKFDVGTIAHSLLLDQSREVAIIVAEDWRTKKAKEERDEAYAAGKVPLLWKQFRDVEAMVRAVREQLDEHNAQPPLLADGKPEQTLVWEEEDGVVCRARLDWLRDDLTAIDDLKSTSRSANPSAYSRALYGVGGDVQAAFYLRGLRRLTGVDAQWRWIVVETSPPYALSVVTPGADVLALGDSKVDFAINRWRDCLKTGVWPAYPSDVCVAEMPVYEEARWLERELREDVAA